MHDVQPFPTRVSRRPSLAVIAAAATVGLLASGLPATASVPTGAISCSVLSDLSTTHAAGILFHPFINAVPRTVRLKANNIGSTCDASGVTGGKAPITGVAFKLTARLPDGTCAALTSAPQLENARLKMKWRGLNPAGHFMTVATSGARVASASYDLGSHALIVVSQPIARGAFAGATVTLQLGFDDAVAIFESGCADVNGYVAMPFGNSNPSSLDVQ